MSEHHITTTDWPNGKRGTLAECSCGWRDHWTTMDGSAESSAYEHRINAGTAERVKHEPVEWTPPPAPSAPSWECPDHPQHCSCHINPPCSACTNCETCEEHYAEVDR